MVEMRRIASIVVALLLVVLVGCDVDPAPAPAGSLTVDTKSMVVRLSDGLSSAKFTFTATQDWHIETKGQAFEVSPMRGKASAEPQTVTITALDRNHGEKTLQRGSFDICLDKFKNKYSVKVEQCAAAERTILTWFFGTSLSYYFGVNIDCMKLAIANNILGNDRFLLFAHTSKSEGVIKELYYDAHINACVENVIRKVALPETLTGADFGKYLSEMMSIAPAEKYALIVGGHSTAWLPKSPSSGGVELSVGGGYLPNWSPAIGAEVTRNIGESSVRLDIDEFAEGLAATRKRFDWIYFDVCFMSSLEAAYELRNQAKYVIGSPCEIMGYGSPFDLLLDELVVDDLDGACRTYYNYYNTSYYGSKSGCIATIVCDELDNLAAKVKALNASKFSDKLDIFSVQTYEGRPAHIFFDAEDFVLKGYDDFALVSDFVEQLDQTVINRYHTEKFYSTYNARMNDINHFSGVNFTPEDGCIALLKSQKEVMQQDVDAKKAELAELKNRLESMGVPPTSSEQYNALYSQVSAAESKLEKMEEQLAELEYYNSSLRKTAWYKATH